MQLYTLYLNGKIIVFSKVRIIPIHFKYYHTINMNLLPIMIMQLYSIFLKIVRLLFAQK